MRFADRVPSDTLRTSFEWRLRRLTSRGWETVLRKKNLQTNYGLTAYASAFQGSYNAPLYMAIDTQKANLYAAVGSGAASFQTDAKVDFAGDTQIVLDSDTTAAHQEVLGITGPAVGLAAPFTYFLTGVTAFAHSSGHVTRAPNYNDTVSQFTHEAQFDATNFPMQRITSIGGYSPGAFQWAMQFYFTKGQAAVYIARCGLFDSPNIGTGNCHNEIELGYDNSSGTTDLELDIVLQLTN